MQLSKKYLPLAIAVVMGLIATFLINGYIKQNAEEEREKAASSQKDLATVVIARQDIPSGTNITENMVEEKTVHRALLQPRAASSVDRAVNKLAVAPISKGEQILLNKLILPGQEMSLSNKIPRGKRAITVPVDNISSVGGMIKPGDHVDVMGMVPVPAMTADGKQATKMSTVLLFQDVLILAVGQEFTNMPGGSDDKKREKTLSPVITLALSPQEANLIAFVQEQGRIRLVLRSPGDAQTQASIPASWEALWATIPQVFQQGDKEAPKTQKTVDIFRGSKKETRVIE